MISNQVQMREKLLIVLLIFHQISSSSNSNRILLSFCTEDNILDQGKTTYLQNILSIIEKLCVQLRSFSPRNVENLYPIRRWSASKFQISVLSSCTYEWNKPYCHTIWKANLDYLFRPRKASKISVGQDY